MKLTIYHLYPDLLDLYGDRGNIIALAARCKWRGIDVEVRQVSLGEELDFSQADLVFLGGGSDREQTLLIADLDLRAKGLNQAIEEGLVVLAICGGFQILGGYFLKADGQKIPGLGLLDFYTVAGKKRLIGNVIAELDSEFKEEMEAVYAPREQTATGPEVLKTLVGFENHSGRTYLGSGLRPLAKIIRGYGNNGEDFLEGVRYKNVFGTYLHGPLLPKNPHLADLLLSLALKRKGENFRLAPLEDNIEIAAHQAILARFSKEKG
ncbi:MAG TPA: glutamine amidotransferase [Peptococcaceae bacterium]|nr:glutamine amidotransferase [Peptococcaceae bacterium]